MTEMSQFEKIRESILGSPPAIRQDIGLLILFWIIASMPWIFGFHFIPFDSVVEFYPQSWFVVDSLRQGDWPWWNPYQYSGLPVLGDPQGMIFTLHTLAGLLLGPYYTLYAFDLITLFYPLMGGLALYGLGCSRGVPRIWLLAAALVFMLGGVATSRLQHVPQIVSYGWLPVLLWLLTSTANKPTLWRALILGLISAFWAANTNQVVFLGGIWLALTASYLWSYSQHRFQLLVMYSLAGFTVVILLFPVYSAMIEVISLSSRAELTLADSTAFSFPGIIYSTLIFPALFGNLGGTRWSVTDITQDFLYIGIIPLCMFAMAYASGISWRKHLLWLWLGSLSFFILFSMGVNTPLYPWLYNHIPGFHLFRRPADAAFIINFMFALGLLIIGREIASAVKNNTAKPASLFFKRIKVLFLSFAVGLPLLSFQLGGMAKAKDAIDVLFVSYGGLVVRIGLLALILILIKRWVKESNSYLLGVILIGCFFMASDIGMAGRYLGTYSQQYSMRKDVESYNEIGQPQPGTLDHLLKTFTAPWARAEVISGFESLGHSSKMRWYNTQGYNPIHPTSYANRIGSYLTSLTPRKLAEDSEGPFDTRYDILGIRYVVFRKTLLNPAKESSSVTRSAQQLRDAIAARGGAPIFESKEYVVWDRPGNSQWLSLAKSESIHELIPATCETDTLKNVRLELTCNLNEPGTLVIGEIYAPGWQACVNDLVTEVKPYFDVFRSVYLPAGKSKLVMTYQPVPFLRSSGCSQPPQITPSQG